MDNGGCIIIKSYLYNQRPENKFRNEKRMKEEFMDILKPTAVIGTNAWGGSLYGKAIRGSYVEQEIIIDAMRTAKEEDIPLYDLARDYGLGKAQKMIGEFGTKDIFISAKYTPFKHYKPGCVRKSLEKDLMKSHFLECLSCEFDRTGRKERMSL